LSRHKNPSPEEAAKKERQARTRDNKRGRKWPAEVPARLTRTSAFAPRRRGLSRDTDFYRIYTVPGHSVLEVKGRELGTQHRDALYALFRLDRQTVKVPNPEGATRYLAEHERVIEFEQVTTTWRHLLRALQRTEHVRNLLNLLKVFEELQRTLITVHEGDPNAILPQLERNRLPGGGKQGQVIGDIEWTGSGLDDTVRVQFGRWVLRAFRMTQLVSLNADVQFRLKSDYAKSFWPYIDGLNYRNYVDETMLGHLVGRDIAGEAETDNTRGQFRKDCRQAFDDMVAAGGLVSWSKEWIGGGHRKMVRYQYRHSLARQMDLPLETGAK